MSRKFKNFLFYKKNDYLVKGNLIPIKEISKIINLVNEILIKEKNKKIETKNQGGTQTHNNYTFAKKGPLHFYVSTSKNI
jgi:hypothetical protein